MPDLTSPGFQPPQDSLPQPQFGGTQAGYMGGQMPPFPMGSLGQFPTSGGQGVWPLLAFLLGGRPFSSGGEVSSYGQEQWRPDYQGIRNPTPMQAPGRPANLLDVVRGMMGSQMGVMNAPFSFLSQPGRGFNWSSALPQPPNPFPAIGQYGQSPQMRTPQSPQDQMGSR